MTVSFDMAMIDSKIGLRKLFQCDLSSKTFWQKNDKIPKISFYKKIPQNI